MKSLIEFERVYIPQKLPKRKWENRPHKRKKRAKSPPPLPSPPSPRRRHKQEKTVKSGSGIKTKLAFLQTKQKRPLRLWWPRRALYPPPLALPSTTFSPTFSLRMVAPTGGPFPNAGWIQDPDPTPWPLISSVSSSSLISLHIGCSKALSFLEPCHLQKGPTSKGN